MRLTELLIKISADPTSFIAGMKTCRAEYRSMERDLATASNRMAGQMSQVGRAATYGLTIPIAAAAVGVAKLSMEFGTSMSHITGLVGVARKQVQAWSKDILNMSGDVGKAPKELADALYYITSSGVKTTEAINYLNLAAKGSAAGLGEVKTVADGLTSVMNAYTGTTLTAADAMDTLVKIVREGKAEPEELAGSIGHVVSITSEMGISFQDLGASVAALSRVGLSSSEAMTGIKRVLQTMLEPTKAATKVMDDFRRRTGDTTLTFSGLRKEAQTNLIGTLLHVKNAFGGNLEAVGKVFGSVRGLNAMLALTGRQSAEVQRIFNSMREDTDDLNEAFKAASETMGFKWQQALASLQASMIEFGDSTADISKLIADKIKELSGWFRSLTDEQKHTIVQIGFMVAAFGPMLFMLGEIGRLGLIAKDVFAVLRASTAILAVQLGATAVQASTFSGSLLFMIGRVGTLTASLWGMAVAFAATPWGQVTLAIAALAAITFVAAKAYDAMHSKTLQTTQELLQESKVVHNLNEKKQANLLRTKQLIDEYNKLKAETNKTYEQKRNMLQIISQLNDISPQYIKQLHDQAGGLDLVTDAANRAANAYRSMSQEVGKSAMIVANYEIASAKASIAVTKEKLEYLTKVSKMTGDQFRQAVGTQEFRNALGYEPKGGMHSKVSPGFVGYTDAEIRQIQIDIENAKLDRAKQIDEFYKKIANQQGTIKAVGDARYPTQNPGPMSGQVDVAPKGYLPSLSGDITSKGSGNSIIGTVPYNNDSYEPWDPTKAGGIGKPKVDQAAQDGLRLLEDYASALLQLRRETDLLNVTTREGTLRWELYNGALSRTAEDGTVLTEVQKEQMLTEARLLDQKEAFKKSSDAMKSTMEEYVKQQMINNGATERDLFLRELSVGVYKSLDESSKKLLLTSYDEIESQRSSIAMREVQLKQLAKEKETRDQVTRSALDYIKSMREEISLSSMKGGSGNLTELQKVTQMFASGGPLRGAKLFGASLESIMTTLAKRIDSNKAAATTKEYLNNLSEEIFQLNEISSVEQTLHNLQSEKYRDLTVWQKLSIMLKAQELQDIKEDNASTRYYGDMVKRILDDTKKLREELTGITYEKRVQQLIDESRDSNGKAKLSQGDAESIANLEKKHTQIREGLTLLQKFAAGTIKVFDDAIDHIFEKGFKGLFSNIVKGFQSMLRQMAAEYLKSMLRKALMSIFTKFMGGGSDGMDAKATGGRLRQGVPTLVGENGVEMILPRSAGSVINSHDLAQYMNSTNNKMSYISNNGFGDSTQPIASGDNQVSNNTSYNVVLHVNGVQDAASFKQNEGQIMAALYQRLEGHAKRNGARRR